MPWTGKVTARGREGGPGCPARARSAAAASTCRSAPRFVFRALIPRPGDPVTPPGREAEGGFGCCGVCPAPPRTPRAAFAPTRCRGGGAVLNGSAVRSPSSGVLRCPDPAAAGCAGIRSWQRRGRNPSPHSAGGDSRSPLRPVESTTPLRRMPLVSRARRLQSQ